MSKETEQTDAIEEEAANEQKAAKGGRKTARKEDAFISELKAEKKVKIRILADKDNAGDTCVPVCINGYIYQVKRGEDAEVPETVADILKEAGYI